MQLRVDRVLRFPLPMKKSKRARVAGIYIKGKGGTVTYIKGIRLEGAPLLSHNTRAKEQWQTIMELSLA